MMKLATGTPMKTTMNMMRVIIITTVIIQIEQNVIIPVKMPTMGKEGR